MEKSRGVGIIKRKEVRRDYLIKRQKSFPKSSEVPFKFLRVWRISKYSRKNRFLEEKRKREGGGVLLSVKENRIGGA